MKSRIYSVFILMVTMTIPFGCASFSTLQTAGTVEKGRTRFGIGAVTTYAFDIIQPEIGIRRGMTERIDWGLKYALPYLAVADVKYQFYKKNMNASFDFAWSLFKVENNYVHGFYPMVITGQKYWYAGIKGIFLISSVDEDASDDSKYSGYQSCLVLGGVLTYKRVKFLFEINTFISVNSKPLPVFGFGFYIDSGEYNEN